jgi:DNA segregation ATPase FtsK/SpoIIIE, S-DNA-T family
LVKTLKELARLRDFAMQEGIDLQKVEGAEADVDAVGERDELFFEAARIVIDHDQGSTSLLQRRLKVGYSRAARIVDQLQEHGIVGPADGSKPREVRIGLEELAEMQKPQAAGRGAGTRSL